MTPRSPDVSVIIPCRDHLAELARCLASLVHQRLDGEYEVIVVDSGLDDAVVATAGRFRSVRVLRGHGLLLPGQARNLGARGARGAFLCFIDADCIAEPGWIAAAVGALQNGARVVGGPVLNGEPWHLVGAIDNLMQFVELPPGRPPGPAQLLPSCNLAISRSDFQAVGGYPQVDLPAGEDVLFCQRSGARWHESMLFVPAMQVRHFGRRTLRGLWRHQQRFGYARAQFGLQLTETYRRLGRKAIMAPVIALRRIAYIAVRAMQWQPASLALLAFGFPILVFGMTAWCIGFHRGSAEAPPGSPATEPGRTQ